MQVIHTVAEMQHICRQESKTIGFVPTMGYLHAGHESLLAQSVQQNQVTVLSLFVNPTQFNQASDYEQYPIDFNRDLAIAEKHHVTYVFLPTREALYPDGYRFQLQENEQSLLLEGAHRPGHFTGVLTIVLKLFNIVCPTKLYLGKKDYQQYELIKEMVNALFLPIEVIGCETIREADGLAMSSRNVRLNKQERIEAVKLYQTLITSKTAAEAQNLLLKNNFKVDYVTDLNLRRYAAVWLGDTRLIDNIDLLGQ